MTEKCGQDSWQHFQNSAPFFLTVVTTHQCIHGTENGITVARGMQQEHIQWQPTQEHTWHMWQQADDWQNFSKKKAAKARAQRWSPAGRMTWWEKGRKWWCHNSAQWENEAQEKSIMDPHRTKILFHSRRTRRAKLDFQTLFKDLGIYLGIFSDFVII